MKKIISNLVLIFLCFAIKVNSQIPSDSLISKKLYKTILKETNISKNLLDYITKNLRSGIVEISYFNIENKYYNTRGIKVSYNINAHGVNQLLQEYLKTNQINDVQIYLSQINGYDCSTPNISPYDIITIQNSISFNLLIEREVYKVPKSK